MQGQVELAEARLLAQFTQLQAEREGRDIEECGHGVTVHGLGANVYDLTGH
ncbi:hypothetical protein [Pseudomonas sp.]|uniref:hypothetical protein n=1 Tax=Pseudomonas sp. TaxID=306 RepID=UPI003D6FA2C2